MHYHKPLRGALLAAAIVLGGALSPSLQAAESANPAAVVKTYADIAEAKYADALSTAQKLSKTIGAFLDSPSPEGMARAKQAWLAARAPYQQSEAYRFGNKLVDDWEGKVNAWPLDEGLIDYVDGASYGAENEENPYYAANVVANARVKVGGQTVDATVINKALIKQLHEIGEVEANVATGYHAIEFLLWGQDLNGNGPGAGNRSWSDFAVGEGCVIGHCARRRAYLRAVTDLLVDDLAEMAAAWTQGGAARLAVTDNPQQGLTAMITGMGSLSYGELAGERMKLGLMLHDPEEEHDCFSDNTHNSHFYDALGIRNVYLGRYVGVDGRVVSGPSLSDLTAAANPALDREMRAKLDATLEAFTRMKAVAEGGMAYDQMIGAGNKHGNAVVLAAINGLVDQTRSIEKLPQALNLSGVAFEGSDSLDNPSSVH
ncbi:imelysin family protein [Magnetofaba australis]|uniref:Putative Insulin-cleaving metalloproteinase outer membrane protein n=1 Tax=Magnetofaba australis IT-1 TaxID=1434232 RepID=A0A1Y2KB29_9PROT|nr:imelysin family protein [Magnetofaba australis]OSM07134.1 putative Insulin-cleaving metalloproteinase outer membrane protein [Magnetofaba australis IT-1]